MTRAAPRQQPIVLDDLSTQQREIVRLRFAHVQEAETGFRSGSALRAAAGEPRPGYDPRCTTLAGRRTTKVAELAALGCQEAACSGWRT